MISGVGWGCINVIKLIKRIQLRACIGCELVVRCEYGSVFLLRVCVLFMFLLIAVFRVLLACCWCGTFRCGHSCVF